MKNTYKVLDLTLTEEEGQDCFVGSREECYNFIAEQTKDSVTSTYQAVPLVGFELDIYNN